MPSEFFQQLVAARRDGTAPGMSSEAPASDAGAGLQVNFYPAPFEGLSTCGRCLALLVTDYAPTHAQWHRELGH